METIIGHSPISPGEARGEEDGDESGYRNNSDAFWEIDVDHAGLSCLLQSHAYPAQQEVDGSH